MAEVKEPKKLRASGTRNDDPMRLAEHVQVKWVAIANAGDTVEDVLHEEYFSHHAANFDVKQCPGRIDVFASDRSWMLELLILASGRNWAKVHLLHKHPLPASGLETETERYRTEHLGYGRFRVIRISDSTQMNEKPLVSKEEAVKFMEGLQKAA